MSAVVYPYYRVLTCTHCGDNVEVIEVPRGWIDPLRYVCGECLSSSAEQLELAVAEEEIRREEPKYDPAQSLLPI